jgi:hypothetical protein
VYTHTLACSFRAFRYSIWACALLSLSADSISSSNTCSVHQKFYVLISSSNTCSVHQRVYTEGSSHVQ